MPEPAASSETRVTLNFLYQLIGQKEVENVGAAGAAVRAPGRGFRSEVRHGSMMPPPEGLAGKNAGGG